VICEHLSHQFELVDRQLWEKKAIRSVGTGQCQGLHSSLKKIELFMYSIMLVKLIRLTAAL
jgi:hypothetical protein